MLRPDPQPLDLVEPGSDLAAEMPAARAEAQNPSLIKCRLSGSVSPRKSCRTNAGGCEISIAFSSVNSSHQGRALLGGVGEFGDRGAGGLGESGERAWQEIAAAAGGGEGAVLDDDPAAA